MPHLYNSRRNISDRLDSIHAQARQNRWLHYFAIFNRVVLAAGFIPAGITKIMGERFASGLSVLHPMGHYLEALHFTGYYYTFIGIAQVAAGVLLLIPQTVVLGALLYFPIILNICILSFAVRFDGSLFTAPLMVLANLYLLCWHYDKIKYIFPWHSSQSAPARPAAYSHKFPAGFFMGVVTAVVAVFGIVIAMNWYAVMPKNSLQACKRQFEGTARSREGSAFCECIHSSGGPLQECLEAYEQALTQPAAGLQ